MYWIPVYELLESRGIEVVLVNARQLHHVPGRKTDMIDCQWLQQSLDQMNVQVHRVHLHLQRAWGRLPHAQAGQRLRSLPSIAEENQPGASARATQARSACAWRDRPTVFRDCAPATLRGLCRPDERASVPPRLATSSRKSRRRCYRDPGKIP